MHMLSVQIHPQRKQIHEVQVLLQALSVQLLIDPSPCNAVAQQSLETLCCRL